MGAKSVFIRVPATIGSLAGATDSAAVALDATLNVKVTARFDGRVSIRYFGDHGDRVPRDRSNLVAQALEGALRRKGVEFGGAEFEMYSSIPVAVGLGSSTAAVLAGLLAADRLYRLELQERVLFELASGYESRADSLRAAWWGGFVIAAEEGAASTYRRVVAPGQPSLLVVIPEIALAPPVPALGGAEPRRSEESSAGRFRRAQALGELFARPESRIDTSLSNAGVPPTCEKVVPGLDEALQAQAPGVLATFVCGSGPAVGILTENDGARAARAVQECFEKHGVGSRTAEFRVSNSGARDWKSLSSEVTLPGAHPLSPPARKSSLIPV